jgi:hypothetical protein
MSLDKIRRVRRRLMVFTAGGPLASITSGLGAMVGGEVILARSDSSALATFLDCYGVWSIFIGLVSVLFLRDGNISDGMILRGLLFSKTEARNMIASHAMTTLVGDRLLPPDYFRRWFRMASLPSRIGNGNYCASWLAYAGAEDTSAAAQWLERCLAGSEQMDEEMRDKLIAEATFFPAYPRNDIAKAEIWWKRLTFPTD